MCSPANPVLREAFDGVYFTLDPDFSYNDPNAGEWSDPPTCKYGIPGIDRTSTIVGEHMVMACCTCVCMHVHVHVFPSAHGDAMLYMCVSAVCSLAENTPMNYLQTGEVRPDERGVSPQVTATLTSSFLVLIGIFFPSVTGATPTHVPGHSCDWCFHPPRDHGWFQQVRRLEGCSEVHSHWDPGCYCYHHSDLYPSPHSPCMHAHACIHMHTHAVE